MNKKKTLVIVWSGGFDSTAVLLKSKDADKAFDNVLVISCKLENAPTECTRLDAEARDKIKSILMTTDGFQRHGFFESSTLDIKCVGEGSGQAPSWAYMASMACANDADTTVQFGYIRGDDFWHFRQHFEQAFFSMCSINGADASIQYPVEWNVKKDSLPIYVDYPEVFANISWGGDTKEIKLKEKEELESTFKMLIDLKNKLQLERLKTMSPGQLADHYKSMAEGGPSLEVFMTTKECPTEAVVNGIVVDNSEKEEKMES